MYSDLLHFIVLYRVDQKFILCEVDFKKGLEI